MMQLNDKVALVLGSIKGIGKAIGLDLAGSGTKVVYTYYDWPESLASLQADATASGQEHWIARINLLGTNCHPRGQAKGINGDITWRISWLWMTKRE